MYSSTAANNSPNRNRKNHVSQLAQHTFEAFAPFINVFDCGGSYFGGVYHTIPKETWQLYARHKQGEKNLRYEDGEEFNVYLDVVRNIYSPLHVQKHLTDGELSYYTSGKRGLGLLYLDIDAHHDWQQDQYRAKATLETLFPFGYFRASKRGQNGYLKVRYSSIHEFNRIADELQANLRKLFLHLGILCDIEVKGTITHKRKSGRLAKLPFATKPASAMRDQSDNWDSGQLERFKSCPIANVRRVNLIGEKLAALASEERIRQTREIKELRLAQEKESPEKNGQPKQKISTSVSKAPVVPPKPSNASEPEPADDTPVRSIPSATATEADDAFVRNHKDIPPFLREFYRQHRRLPSTNETLAWLKSHRLYSGDWEDHKTERAKRVGQILQFKQQTFDPQKLSGGEHKAVELRLGKFTGWVRARFGSQLTGHVVELRGFDPVSMTAPMVEVNVPAKFIETFVVVADACLNQDPLDNKAVPTNRFKALWKLVKHGAPWNQKYFQVVRDTLHRMGVIKIVDRHHHQGKAWQWEAGPCFPTFISKAEGRKLKRSRQLVVVTTALTDNVNDNKVHNTLYHTDAMILAIRGAQPDVRPPP